MGIARVERDDKGLRQGAWAEAAAAGCRREQDVGIE